MVLDDVPDGAGVVGNPPGRTRPDLTSPGGSGTQADDSPDSMRIVSVVGARPNFMKLAPVHRSLVQFPNVDHVVVHTGQHYDEAMVDVFLSDLQLPLPQYDLGVGSGSHGKQTAAILERCEEVCEALRPEWVLVYGDVNSTVAAALAAVKLGIRVAHVEAGLRSRDRRMPEEHNRVVTDHLADILFAPSQDAVENLLGEGVPAERVAFVGNVMIDTLVAALPAARATEAPKRRGLVAGQYAVVTLHRPSNVDDPVALGTVTRSLATIAREMPVIFPMHPRARERLASFGLVDRIGAVHLLDPVSYLEMLSLVDSARLVITDSGGLQEETAFLGVPCFTVRPNTERPITLTHGTNQLVADPHRLADAVLGQPVVRKQTTIDGWDGRAGERIGSILCGNGGWRGV